MPSVIVPGQRSTLGMIKMDRTAINLDKGFLKEGGQEHVALDLGIVLYNCSVKSSIKHVKVHPSYLGDRASAGVGYVRETGV